MMDIENIFNILLEGTKAQIGALGGSGASYRYTASCGVFAVIAGHDEIRAHKLFEPPNCVQLFGAEHVFRLKPA